jgi:hypothetical protein
VNYEDEYDVDSRYEDDMEEKIRKRDHELERLDRLCERGDR